MNKGPVRWNDDCTLHITSQTRGLHFLTVEWFYATFQDFASDKVRFRRDKTLLFNLDQYDTFDTSTTHVITDRSTLHLYVIRHTPQNFDYHRKNYRNWHKFRITRRTFQIWFIRTICTFLVCFVYAVADAISQRSRISNGIMTTLMPSQKKSPDRGSNPRALSSKLELERIRKLHPGNRERWRFQDRLVGTCLLEYRSLQGFNWLQ